MGKLTRALTERLLGKTWNALRSGIADSVVPGSGGIVMLGDSITHFGRWDLLFPNDPVRNFGIGGERSDHLLRRLDPIVNLRPRKIFVLIGTNDLASGYTPDEIAANVDELFRRLRAALPDCECYVQGVMPRQRKYAARIHALNANYQAIATKHAATFIDLFPALDDGSGELQAQFTMDRLHLNGPGYVRWREVLMPHMQDASSR